MADKRIQDLTPASQVQTSDRFVLEQSGQAKSLTGQILINDLAAFLDGHGGINDISYTPPTSGSLTGTLTVTLADGTVETFSVTNGRGITSITKTGTSDLEDTYEITYNDGSTPTEFTVTNGRSIESIGYVESVGLDDYYQINYNDDSDPTTFIVHNGAKGDTGDNWYVHIKWSATEPTQDSDMSDTPDNWIGIYSGLGETAPTSYSEYTWFEYKGETGDTGNGIESISLYSSSGVVDTYRVLFTNGSSTTFDVTNGSNISSITKTSSAGLTDTYTVTLTNSDTTSFTVSNAKSITSITPPGNPGLPGQTDRYIINFNNGDATFFDVYNGTNGTGSVSLVDNIAPLGGSVPLLTFGNGAPTVDTPGSVKSRYFDTLNNQLYICVAVDEESTPNTYTWRGSSVTVDSYLSTTSTNPVQNAVLTALLGTTPLDTTAQTLTGAVNEILDDISGFADNLADEYDATATYAVGDLCLHDNTLYRCNTAISTPETWNSIHWTATSVDEQLDGKVSKSGDTMSGALSINLIGDPVFSLKNPTYAIGDQDLTQNSMSAIRFYDKNDATYSLLRGFLMSNGATRFNFAAVRPVSGSVVQNGVNLTISDDGTRTVAVDDAAAWRTAIGAVNKAGDTMTGDLTNTSGFTIKHPTASYTNPPSTASSILYTAQDSTSNEITQLRSQIRTNGSVQTYLNARRIVSGSSVFNGVAFEILSDGTRNVSFDYPQGVRSALGLGTSGALPITIAQGGTGQTSVSGTSTVSSIATAGTNIAITGGYYYWWGKVAHMRLDIKPSANISSGSTIATIVSGKRPTLNLYVRDSSDGRIEFTTSGAVMARHALTSGTTYYITAVYLIAN